jgi:alpha-glucosidase
MVSVGPHQGSFAPWWNRVSIEVYGASKSATTATTAAGTKVSNSFDSEHHRITVQLPDDGKGLELQLAY